MRGNKVQSDMRRLRRGLDKEFYRRAKTSQPKRRRLKVRRPKYEAKDGSFRGAVRLNRSPRWEPVETYQQARDISPWPERPVR